VVDEQAAQLVLEDGGGDLRCSSDFSGGGDDELPSFKQHLDSGGLDSVDRWRKLGRLMVARV
jgi:hypothetical protein